MGIKRVDRTGSRTLFFILLPRYSSYLFSAPNKFIYLFLVHNLNFFSSFWALFQSTKCLNSLIVKSFFYSYYNVTNASYTISLNSVNLVLHLELTPNFYMSNRGRTDRNDTLFSFVPLKLVLIVHSKTKFMLIFYSFVSGQQCICLQFHFNKWLMVTILFLLGKRKWWKCCRGRKIQNNKLKKKWDIPTTTCKV